MIAVALAAPASASATSSPIKIGANTNSGVSTPAVAVDSSGTAYIAWLIPSTVSANTIDFCKLLAGATSCAPVAITITGHPEGSFFDPPSVLLSGGDVDVFETVAGDSDNDQNGMDEFVSTDGGASFTLTADSISDLPVGNVSATTNPVIALPGGDIGVGADPPGGNPEFQANSLSSPSDDSVNTEATAPFATLNPSPASAYSIGNLGGQFASQLTGSEGVLGVFESLPDPGLSPCPSSAPSSLVYAWAPLSASASSAAVESELNTSPGTAGSAWGDLSELDCVGDYPAVGGGPSGLGVLETNVTTLSDEIIQYRRFAPPSTFGSAVTLAAGASNDASVSQDGAGGVYATWLDSDTGINLDYSGTGGSTWDKAVILLGNQDGAVPISGLTSAVGSSGQGWAVYANGGSEYAQPFDTADVVPAKPASTAVPTITGSARTGKTLTCGQGRWTNDPTGYTYQWYDDGSPLAGATDATYKVTTLEEGTTLTCVVTATNAGGSASATSKGVKIPIPFVPKCPGATGRLSGGTLGLIVLDASRSREHYLYRHHSDRGKRYEDFFCLTPIGVRVGYGSPKLLKILSKTLRKQLLNRVVWASTSNPHYSIGGVRPGESIVTASAALHPLPVIHIGLNHWYLAVQKRSTAVLKVRGGVVEEIGIATNRLTKTAKDRSVLMHSFY
jgi:hypothetical protein